MNFGPLSISDLKELLPYALLTGGAMFLILASLVLRGPSALSTVMFAAFGITVAAALSILMVGQTSSPFGGLLVHDRSGTGFAWVTLLLLALVIPLFSVNHQNVREGPGGVFSLLLLSTCGTLCMVFANHFLTFFIGLELLSLPLYVLVGLGRNSLRGTEAAFKYFLLGSVASAFFLYGSALLWGSLGTLTLSEMALAYTRHGYLAPGSVAIGLTLVILGLFFKVGLVPFHMWVPDVYEGSPAYVVSWMSGAVKAATLAFAVRLFGDVFNSQILDFSWAFVWIAIASMVWGSVAALSQESVKRLLAYSSVAHAGYALIGLVCAQVGHRAEASSALIYYTLSYGVASLACFAIASLEEAQGRSSVADLAGLSRRRPILAFAFSLALLSLAGLPPLAGFFAKFNLFSLAIRSGHVELVFVGVIASVVSMAYYLRLIVAMYMEEPMVTMKPDLKVGTWAVLVAASALIVGLGIFPSLVFDFLSQPIVKLIP